MVATRKGVRVYSPTRGNSDENSDASATPSVVSRTRSAANQEQTLAQGKATSQSSMKRCRRVSRVQNLELPSTPVGSCHEADVSDVDSSYSAVSDTETPMTRTRRQRGPLMLSQEEKEASEVESCSSVVSSLRGDRSTHRRTRSARKKIPESPDPVHTEEGDVETESFSPVMSASQRVTRSQRRSNCTRSSAKEQNEDLKASDADSSTSSTQGGELPRSTTSRATRYGRRSVVTQPIPMHLDEDSEGSQSPAPSRRRTRAAKGKATSSVSDSQTCDSEGFESSPMVTEQRMTRSQAKAKHLAQTAARDSDSELTQVYSPQCRSGSAEDRGTPCSSRQGSGSSGRAVRVTRLSGKAVTHSPESAESMPAASTPIKPTDLLRDRCQSLSEPADDGDVLNDSEFERTVITDPDCTVLGEDTTLTLQEEDQESSVRGTEPAATPEEAEVVEVGRQGSVIVSVTADVMDDNTSILASTSASQVSRDTTEEGKGEAEVPVEDEINTTADLQVSLIHSVMVSDPAVAAADQQVELSAENGDGDATEMELSQEQPSAEPLQQRHSVTVGTCENTATAEGTGEKPVKDTGDAGAHADALASQRESLQDELSAGAAESLDREEEMEVSTITKARQVVGSSEVSPSPAEPDPIQVEVIKVTSSQDQKVTVESNSEQNPQNSGDFVKATRKIILLDSSDDEDEDSNEDADGNESSGEEEEGDHEDMGVTEGKRAGPSSKSEGAAASVEGLFMIDTRPGEEANEQYYMDDLNEQRGRLERERVEQEEDEFVDEEVDDDDDDEDAKILFSSRNPQQKELSSCIDAGLSMKELGGLYVSFDGRKSKPVSSCTEKLQDELMKKSVIHPEFEKKDAVPPYIESKKALKLKNKAERERTTGDGWFNMKAPELTQELKGDLKLLKMRGSLDPKRFYKKNDRDGFPKYFQVGTVVDNPVDFYHSRIPKKARKRTMVEELLVDAEFRHQNKKKFQQIMAEKAAHGAGRRNKKKNKFKKK